MAIGIRLVIALYARRGAERTGLGRDRPRIRLYGIPSPAPRGARDIDYDIDYIREYRVIASRPSAPDNTILLYFERDYRYMTPMDERYCFPCLNGDLAFDES